MISEPRSAGLRGQTLLHTPLIRRAVAFGRGSDATLLFPPECSVSWRFPYMRTRARRRAERPLDIPVESRPAPAGYLRPAVLRESRARTPAFPQTVARFQTRTCSSAIPGGNGGSHLIGT